jgi:signal transduction histidine kinase
MSTGVPAQANTDRVFRPTLRRASQDADRNGYAVAISRREKQTLLAAAALFGLYYLSFAALGLYTTASLLAGVLMAISLLGAALAPRIVLVDATRASAVAVAVIVPVGATCSAYYSAGSACVGFHTLWAIPLIYSLFYEDQPVGTAVAWGGAFLGGMFVLDHGGESPSRMVQWAVLSVSAALFTIVIQHKRRSELALLMHTHEQAITRLKDAERLTAMGVLAAGVSHEIRNPLFLISSNLELARELLQSDGDAANRLQTLDAMLADAQLGCERATGVATTINSLSGTTGPGTRAFNVNKFVASLVKLSRADVVKHGTISVVGEAARKVKGDEARLGQVVINLIANATRAVAARKDGPRSIVVRSADLDSDRVLIEVSDQGIGMDGADLKRIFDPYYTTRRETGGTGLGLTLCCQIVDELGGYMEVESELGRGSTFRVVLPAAV